MVCFHPLKAFRARTPSAKGTRSIVFNKMDGYADIPVKLACGQCVGCRLERSRQWAVRCMHEAKLHTDNCFITLTYSDACLPAGNTLVLDDFQKFMKRLRKRYGKVRFYHCGEYGEKFGRPHYHACLFGFDFPDKVFFRVNANGDDCFQSSSLKELWPLGLHEIGSVTFQSAAYVARYIMKKVTGDAAAAYYESIDSDGVVSVRLPEYTTMSRRPGIGSGFFDRFASDVYPHDFVVVNERKARPPRYYDGLYEVLDPDGFRALKARRIRNGKKHSENNTPDRLKVREEVTSLKLERLKREYE